MRGFNLLSATTALLLLSCAAWAADVQPAAAPQNQPATSGTPTPKAAQVMSVLAPFSANYEVRLNNLPFKANARQVLKSLGGDRWRLTLTIKSFLLDTTEFSEFRWDGQTCHTIPEHYGYSRNGIGKDKSLDMRFDFATGTLKRHDGRTVKSFRIGTGIEDKLGHTLAVACRVARGARGTLGVDVAWDHEVRHFDYVISKTEELIATPLGSFRAVRVERQRADDDRITATWLSAAAGWRTVRMQHSEGDGRLFQLQLLELDNGK